MPTVHDVFAYLNEKAPVSGKMEFDNVGLLVGRREMMVHKILTALDITDEVIAEAAELGAELVVSHHPLFFSLKTVTDGTGEGAHVLALAENRLAAICMHTNLDAADGGVNDALMAALGGDVTGILEPDTGIGRVGMLDRETAFSDFLRFTKDVLRSNGLRYHDAGRPVRKIAVCGGSGGGDIGLAAAAGCICDGGCEIQPVFRGQKAGHKSDRRGPLLHGKRGGPRAEKLAGRGVPGGGGPHLPNPRPERTISVINDPSGAYVLPNMPWRDFCGQHL